MKLRIRDDSIRLRLTRSEVDTLRDTGIVSASTGFPDGRLFSYSAQSSPASVTPAASYTADGMTVSLPESLVLSWAASEQVSMEGEQALDEGRVLKILVEKDFACLAPREGEDESDMFPHPDADRAEC